MTYRCLVWDMDGTLFNTYPAMARTLAATLADFEVTVGADHVQALLRRSFGYCLDVLAVQYDLDPDAVLAQFTPRYRQILLKDQPPFPGAVEVCRAVAEGGGVNLIFTHRSRRSLERFLAAYGMTDLFAATLTTDDGYPPKPDPAGLLAVGDACGVPRAQTLTIGDRPQDIIAGQRAGMATCFFSPGQAAPDGCQPDYRVADYTALRAILFPQEAHAGTAS
jgi:HAD superfamily hydrolase (TIGR01509 family)